MIRIFLQNDNAGLVSPYVDGSSVMLDPKYGLGVEILAYNRDDLKRKMAAYDKANKQFADENSPEL